MWNFNQFSDDIAAISDEGGILTYKELEAANADLITYIENVKLSDTESGQEVGTRERCLVFSLCTNSLGSLVGYTAFLNNNIVPLLLDSKLDMELLKDLMVTYKPSYIWIPQKESEQFPNFEPVYNGFGYSLLKTDFTGRYPLFHELALLLTTSGSTGSPKLVRQSYENISSNMKSIVQYLKLDGTEKPITTLPMNYTYGLSIINSHLSVGATLLLTDKTLMEKEFWSFFKTQGATSFGGVPYTYEILNKLRFFQMQLPSLRTMTQAGGKLSPELHKKFAEYAIETGRHFVVMYGQTEATARMSYLPYEKSLERYGSMGIAIPGGKFSLLDAEGRNIEEPDIVGELVYEGANVTLGYAECGEDLAKEDERFGKLITGDMAKRDVDGYYYIVGRKKRFLKIFGNRVNLDEAERLIQSHYGEIDCACGGIDDKLYIFITDGSVKEEIKRYLSEKTGLNLSAFHVQVVDKIPRNEAGKTLYSRLELYY
jgi:Acyl-CoA synthetases (AMP-forming)/AMP-acid ligases II